MLLATINDIGYQVILYLHILTAFLAFSPMFVNLSTGQLVRSSERIYGYSLIFSGLLGFGLAGMSDKVYRMGQPWLIAAFLIWIAMNGVLHAITIPAEKAIAGADSAGNAAAEKKLRIAGLAMTMLFVIQLWLMISKPGL